MPMYGGWYYMRIRRTVRVNRKHAVGWYCQFSDVNQCIRPVSELQLPRRAILSCEGLGNRGLRNFLSGLRISGSSALKVYAPGHCIAERRSNITTARQLVCVCSLQSRLGKISGARANWANLGFRADEVRHLAAKISERANYACPGGIAGQ